MLDCKQPDGSWKTYERAWDRERYTVTAEAVVGSGTLRFKYAFLQVLNDGDVAGTVFGKVVDDAGKTIWSKSGYLEPGLLLVNEEEILFDMPNRDYTLTFKAGHDTTTDETLTLTVKPKAAAKVTLGLALMLLGALTPIIFSLAVVGVSELKKRYYI
jgi:hypothetical protein